MLPKGKMLFYIMPMKPSTHSYKHNIPPTPQATKPSKPVELLVPKIHADSTHVNCVITAALSLLRCAFCNGCIIDYSDEPNMCGFLDSGL